MGNAARPRSDKPRPSLREEQRQVTRRRLIGASRAQFESHGYAGASVGDIASAAGVYRATFYLHFPNKAAVFYALLDEITENADPHWRTLNTALLTGTRSAMRKWLASAKGWWVDNAALMPAYKEALATDLEIANRLKTNFDTQVSIIEPYLHSLKPSQRDSTALAIELLLLQLDEVYYRCVVQKAFADSNQLLETLTDTWCRTLQLTRN